MKSQLKKIKGASLNTSKGDVMSKDYFQLEQNEFDQMFFTTHLNAEPERVKDSNSTKLSDEKLPNSKTKVYFVDDDMDSDQEFELKVPKKSEEAPRSTKIFEGFQNYFGKHQEEPKGKITKSIEKKSQSYEEKKKRATGRDSDNQSKNSKNGSENPRKVEKSTISFQQFGIMAKDKPDAEQPTNDFNIFNQINSKPAKKQSDKEIKHIPPRPPKKNATFEEFNNIFTKENHQQKHLDFEDQIIKKQIEKPPSFDMTNPFSKDLWPMDMNTPINHKLEEILKALKLKELKDLLKKNPKLIITFSELSFEKVIGSGSAGDVYLGRYKNEKVAIKKVKCKENPNALKQFERELITYIRIKKNPYLVSLIGLSQDNGDFYLLTEFCEGGCLFDILHKKIKDIALTWSEKLEFAIEIAQGMNCLHEMKPPIIHRDLKSLNVFVTRKQHRWGMKVADFGLARSPEADMMTTQLGTIHWMAPELLQGKQYSIKVDVYSYGVLLWQIITRKTPYSNLNSPMAILKHVAIDQRRPDMRFIEKDCPQQIIKVMKKCWGHQPTRRPSFQEIIAELTSLRVKISK